MGQEGDASKIREDGSRKLKIGKGPQTKKHGGGTKGHKPVETKR